MTQTSILDLQEGWTGNPGGAERGNARLRTTEQRPTEVSPRNLKQLADELRSTLATAVLALANMRYAGEALAIDTGALLFERIASRLQELVGRSRPRWGVHAVE